MMLTLWMVKIPHPARREAFEDDMKENNSPGGCQETESDVVDGLVARSIGETFVEKDLYCQYPQSCQYQHGIGTIPALISHNDVIYSTDPGMTIYSVSMSIYVYSSQRSVITCIILIVSSLVAFCISDMPSTISIVMYRQYSRHNTNPW